LGMGEKEPKTLERRWKEVEREDGDGRRGLEGMKRGGKSEYGWSEEKERMSLGVRRSRLGC
jgi:hypothetical protein